MGQVIRGLLSLSSNRGRLETARDEEGNEGKEDE